MNKKNLTNYLIANLFFLVAFSTGPRLAFAKNILESDPCDTAIILRGGDHLAVNFYRSRSGQMATLLIGIVASQVAMAATPTMDGIKSFNAHTGELVLQSTKEMAVEGLKNTAIASAAQTSATLLANETVQKDMTTSKKSKLASKDFEKEGTLNAMLKGWSFQDHFVESFRNNLPAKYKNICDVIPLNSDPKRAKFKKVDAHFYKNAAKFYRTGEPIFDYSPLAKLGITKVVEVSLQGTMTAKNPFAGKPIPLVESNVRVLDLEKQALTLKKYTVLLGKGKMKHSFEEILVDNASLVKNDFEQLAGTLAQKSAKKLKK